MMAVRKPLYLVDARVDVGEMDVAEAEATGGAEYHIRYRYQAQIVRPVRARV